MNTLPIPRFHTRCNLWSVTPGPSDDIDITEINNLEFRLESQSDFSAILRGPQQLDQDDCRIFWRAWLIASSGKWTPVSLAALAGDGANAADRHGVLQSLRRVARSTVEIVSRDGGRYIHGLLGIKERGRRDSSDSWKGCVVQVRVDPDLLEQLTRKEDQLRYVKVDIRAIEALGRAGLASWLGTYLLSHRDIRPIPVSDLYRMSGSRSTIWEFKRLLKNACKKIAVLGIEADVVSDNLRYQHVKVQAIKRKLEFETVDLDIATMIWQRVQIVNPAIKQPNLESWANEIRLLREKDGHSVDLIRKVFMWANRDNFWCGNILSAKTLRMKFPTLVVQMKRPPTKPTMASVNAGGRGRLVL